MKKYLALLISLFPSNYLRVLLYKRFFNYDITNSYIGWRTIIIVDKASLNECRIDSKVLFNGPMKINLKEGVRIKKNNTFLCGKWTKTQKFSKVKYKRYLEIGEDSIISKDHYFDLAGSIIIGKSTRIAGRNSQFWTHGAGVTDRNIVIGNNCYIGSAVRFAPGSSIGNNTIVSLASIVTKKFKKENVLIGGQPAKIIKENYFWNTYNQQLNDNIKKWYHPIKCVNSKHLPHHTSGATASGSFNSFKIGI